MKPTNSKAPIEQQIQTLYQSESRRVLATLIRLLGDFDLAEEALHNAFAAALEQWPQNGLPDNPRAWLVSAGRFKAIDRIRRRQRFTELSDQLPPSSDANDDELYTDDDRIPDDRLRLIFTCCHPSLSPEARTALTLREVCDLTTEEIASAYLAKPSTIAQRIVRAKRKIQSANIPYEVPGPSELTERLQSVLQVIYLVFNEGYSASSGAQATRVLLADEAIRLGRLLHELLPEPEVTGLLALMRLNHSRHQARTSPTGGIITLEEQDRSLWDASAISEGCALVREALNAGPPGAYVLQAAISAVHAEAPRWAATDWAEIVGLYDLLLRVQPSPVVALNRIVALSYHREPLTALTELETLLATGELDQYLPARAAQADLLRRLNRLDEAASAYAAALTLTNQQPEQSFLTRRLNECKKINSPVD
ncbi:RNA polymerase sigma factor [Gilvimarinus agarilyticus]|uniref:RNA polymerase sigma factor n=1 Tax=Gilvimarinus agarilyticus TaxID=679259 RepID=UPI000AF4DBB1|nr:RNA polymerase sigma factor [Gilvimarinus agarilyticus]